MGIVLGKFKKERFISDYFTVAGGGISRRYKKIKAHWQPHLESTKDAQKKWLKTIRGDNTLWILGAGDLLDTDLKIFENSFSNIVLIDANENCLRRWEKVKSKSRLYFSICDITGIITDCEQCLNRLSTPSSYAKAISNLDFLENIIKTEASPLYSLPKPDAVISLNILSQLPIALRDLIEKYLERFFSRSWLKNNEEQWLEKYYCLGSLILDSHIKTLNEISPKNLLIISDTDYINYFGGPVYRNAFPAAAPISLPPENKFSDDVNSINLTQEISKLEITPALHGLKIYDLPLCNFTSEHISTWAWHIQPRGYESFNFGTVHKVSSFSYKNNSQTTL